MYKDKTVACVALVTEVKWLKELKGLGEKNGLEVAALILSWIFQGIYTEQRVRAPLVTFSLARSPSGSLGRWMREQDGAQAPSQGWLAQAGAVGFG